MINYPGRELEVVYCNYFMSFLIDSFTYLFEYLMNTMLSFVLSNAQFTIYSYKLIDR